MGVKVAVGVRSPSNPIRDGRQGLEKPFYGVKAFFIHAPFDKQGSSVGSMSGQSDGLWEGDSTASQVVYRGGDGGAGKRVAVHKGAGLSLALQQGEKKIKKGCA